MSTLVTVDDARWSDAYRRSFGQLYRLAVGTIGIANPDAGKLDMEGKNHFCYAIIASRHRDNHLA